MTRLEKLKSKMSKLNREIEKEKAFIQKIEGSKPWKPSYGDDYFIVYHDGEIDARIHLSEKPLDDNRRYYKTESLAIAANCRKAGQRNLESQCHAPSIEAWRDIRVVKYFLTYSWLRGKLIIKSTRLRQTQGTIYTTKKEDLLEFMKQPIINYLRYII